METGYVAILRKTVKALLNSYANIGLNFDQNLSRIVHGNLPVSYPGLLVAF